MNKNEYYGQAVRRLEEYRCAALQRQAENIAAAYKKVPEIADFDRELKKNMRAFMTASLDHTLTDEEAKHFSSRSIELQATRAETLYAKSGFKPEDLEPAYHCRECGDEGYVNGKMCKCLKKLLAEEYLNHSNLAASYKNRTFKNVEVSLFGEDNQQRMKLLTDFCRRYVKEFPLNKQSLYFFGVPGCGKTFMSTVIGTELVNNGVFVFYSPAQDMISSFEAEKFGKTIAGAVDTEVYNTCEMLIIDDLGTEFSTPFAENVLYNVINTRINKNLPTVISSNYAPEELEEVYNDRLISRLKYEFMLVEFPSVDIREKKKEKKK